MAGWQDGTAWGAAQYHGKDGGGPGRVPLDLSFHTTLCTLYRPMAHGTTAAPLMVVTIAAPRLLRGAGPVSCRRGTPALTSLPRI